MIDKIVSSSFYENIKSVLLEARSNAFKTINSAMVNAYWNPLGTA